jgi:hypothetical protein
VKFADMRVRIAPLIILLAVLAFSCSHKSKRSRGPAMTASGQKLYAVIVDFTAFYVNGPQQANGPDKHLPKNTLMTVIRPSFGFSKVKLEANGQEGYVSTADIKTAPAELAASVQASPSPLPLPLPSPSVSPSSEGFFPRESPSSEVTTPTPRETPSPEPSAPVETPTPTPLPEATTSVDSVFPRFTPSSSDSPVSEPTALPSPGN